MEREDTTIRVKKNTLRNLNRLKYKLNVKNVNEVINRMLIAVSKFKLWEELK